MTKKRHSIDTIAEVLIDKLSDMEQVAEKIEKASKTTLKIDVGNMQKLLDEQRNLLTNQNQEEKDVLINIQRLQDKNRTRLPNWVFAILFAFFVGLIGSMYFAYNSVKKVDDLERHNKYYLQQIKKLQNTQIKKKK